MADPVVAAAMSAPSLDTLAVKIRLINTLNGWDVLQADDWESQPHKVPAILALIHSEITEAYVELRYAEFDLAAVECADVLIRILDAVGALTSNFDNLVKRVAVTQTAATPVWRTQLLDMHRDVTNALEAYRINDSQDFLLNLARLFARVDRFMVEELRVSPYETVSTKLEKNRKRGYRHGGKRA